MLTLLGGACLSTALLSASVQANDSAMGYAQDSSGGILRTSSGDCVHTSSWNAADATIVGCDGAAVDTRVELVKGDPAGLVSATIIPAAALFAFDSAELSDAGKQAIDEYRETLRPGLTDAYAAIISGHTDSTGDENYNMDLSLRRAGSVRDYLVSTGTDGDKLRVLGRGELEPIASNETKEGQAVNRRVEIIVVGEVRALDAMRFPSVALFPRRRAELTAEGKAVINRNYETARAQLERATYVEIIGHTDDVGDDAYNQDLSEQRAANVYDYLVEIGADPSKMVTVGAGERMPIASNKTPEGRAENRRVEVLVLGNVK
jgi:OOP family OmpA-OmpF porin